MGWESALGSLGSAVLGVFGQRQANRENRLQQEKFASEGIRMRVADAKAAGLHPLFALGANVSGYSPSAQNVFDASFGQNISRAATQFSSEERELRQEQLNAARASTAKDMAMAAAYDAQAAIARQELGQSKPVVIPGALRDEHGAVIRDDSVGGIHPLATDATWAAWRGDYAPGDNPRPYRSPEFKQEGFQPLFLTKGAQAGFTEYYWPSGKGKGSVKVMLPSQNMSEALEGLEDTALQALIVGANVAAYGDDGKAEFQRLAKSWIRSFRRRGGGTLAPPVSRGRLAP